MFHSERLKNELHLLIEMSSHISYDIRHTIPAEMLKRDPLIDELLNTNKPPQLATQLKQIRGDLNVRTSYINRLRETIEDARRVLERLQAEEARAVKDLQDHTRVASVLRRLPSEVLSMLMVSAAADDGIICPPKSSFKPTQSCQSARRPSEPTLRLIDVDGTPWKVAQVCKQWRSVAEYGAHRMWSHVNLQLHPKITVPLPNTPTVSGSSGSTPRSVKADLAKSENFVGITHALGLYLQRSGSFPLSVRLIAHPRPLDHWQRTLFPLVNHASRFQDLVVEMERKTLVQLKEFHGSLVNLKSLQLIHKGPHININVDVFELASALHRVRLTAFNHVADRLSLPWSQLTSYTWEDTTSGTAARRPQHFRTLCRMPALRDCSLDCREDEDVLAANVLTLDHLQSFTVKDCDGSIGNVADLLAKLRLPALKDLDVTLFGISQDIPSLLSLLDRSKCELTSLTLRHMPSLASGGLLQILKAVPLLQHLSVTGNNSFSGKVIKDLTVRVTTNSTVETKINILLPSLSRIHVWRILTSDDVNALLEMITSRCNSSESAVPLQTLSIEKPLDDADNLAHIGRIKECCSESNVEFSMRSPAKY